MTKLGTDASSSLSSPVCWRLEWTRLVSLGWSVAQHYSENSLVTSGRLTRLTDVINKINFWCHLERFTWGQIICLLFCDLPCVWHYRLDILYLEHISCSFKSYWGWNRWLRFGSHEPLRGVVNFGYAGNAQNASLASVCHECNVGLVSLSLYTSLRNLFSPMWALGAVE